MESHRLLVAASVSEFGKEANIITDIAFRS